MAKKNSYATAELAWAEEKLEEWKEYIDSNPLPTLKDRIEYKPTAKGGVMPMVVASIESQIKSIRDTLKEYLALLDQVDKMREKEAAKDLTARGGGEIPHRMRNRINNEG